MKHLVFVYGTLRRGEGNHRLLASEQYVGAAVSARAGYALYQSSIPFLVDANPGDHVAGELYAVSSAALLKLDALEGHPYHYRRMRRRVTTAAGNAYTAWMYLYPRDQLSWVKKVAAVDGVVTAARQERVVPPPRCSACGLYRADPPSTLCPGCQAYQAHVS